MQPRGLGVDFTPWINAGTQIAQSAAQIEAARQAAKQPAMMPTAPAGQAPARRGIPPIVMIGGVVALGAVLFIMLRKKRR